jgi:serine/threonine protein kinase
MDRCRWPEPGIPEGVPETDQLSRYRTISTLGAGGMAIVVLAEDTLLGRQVALKRMTVAGDPRQGLRLRREALIGASISHANLVSVYDVFTGPDGDLTVVMEYVEGETLARRLDREGRLAGTEAIRILRGVAAALDAIHNKGIVHRDVKPPNILLGRAGVVKVADLGVASVPDYTRITSSGAVVGSLRYMAPEQVENGPATKAIDVYALSAVAFEMLSGRKARLEENPLALAHAIANQPPPNLLEAWPQAPAPAAALLERAMSRDPQQRPTSAGELVDKLGKILVPPAAPSPARRAAPSPARRAAPSPAPPVVAPSTPRQAAPSPPRQAAPSPARQAAPRPTPPAIQPATAPTRAAAPARYRPRRYPAKPPPPRPQRAAPDDRARLRRWVPAAALLLVLVVAGGLVAILSSSGGNSNSGGPAAASGSSHHHRGSAKSAGSGSTAASAGSGSTSGSTGSGSAASGSAASGSAASGSTAASSPPVGSTTGGASTPIAAVESFYSLGAAHRYSAAWSLADPAFRSQLGSYDGFAGGQQQVRSVRFDAAQVVSQSGSTATVSLRTTSTHIDGSHQCSGTVDVVRNGAAGTWLLHQIHIDCT